MPNPTDDATRSNAQESAIEGVRKADRPVAVIQTFDTRWLVGIAVIVPVGLIAGVYWLHQLPANSQGRLAGPVVEVRLVQELRSQPMPVVAARPDQMVATGRSEPLVAAPKRPIPEETTSVASVSAVVPPDPGVSRGPPSTPLQQQPTPSGSASAYQRLLLSHIARYLRYPKGAQSSQLHGVVQVRFAMRRDGTVIEAWVLRSSGHPLLDEAATETIRQAQPLPVIPADLPDTLTVLWPVSFDAP